MRMLYVGTAYFKNTKTALCVCERESMRTFFLCRELFVVASFFVFLVGNGLQYYYHVMGGGFSE
jgi:hypothetical protein